MFKLTFKTDNAAFEAKAQECYDILKEIAEKVSDGRCEGKIHDHNGNHIGTWKLT